MSTVILLYSKFSKKSLDLMESMEGVLEFRKLCIDHPNIRSQVMKNGRLPIREVPCIFVLFPDGRKDVFEGMQAYQWLHDTLENIKRFATPPAPLFTELSQTPPSAETEEPPPVEEHPMEAAPSMKQVKNSGESIQNMAAQLQAEREREDENQHPNAFSKIKPPE